MKISSEIFEILFNKKSDSDSLFRHLVSGTWNTIWIQLVSFVLIFGTSFVMTNLLGAADYGTFTYIFSVIYITSNLSTLGYDFFLVKNLAAYQSKNQWGKIKGAIKHTYLIVALVMVVSMLILFVLFNQLGFFSKIGNVKLFYISLLALPLAAFLIIGEATLQGIKKIKESQLPEKIIKPLSFLLFISVMYFFFPSLLHLTNVILANILSFGIAFLFVIFLINNNISPFIKDTQAEHEKKLWLKSSLFFLLLNTCYMINGRIDILLLGALKDSHEVGIYNICARLADVLAFGFAVVNIVLSPTISSLYSNNEKGKLQKILTSTVQITAAFTFLLFTAILLFSENILSIFGNEFVVGKNALVILCAGQLFNVVCGSVGQILIMTGNEKFAFVGVFTSVVINIFLNLILTKQFGFIGTAISTSISLMLWNIILIYFVMVKTKIHPTVFGKVTLLKK